VSRRQTLSHGADGRVALVELVVEEYVFLVLLVIDNALMHVLRAWVGCPRDDVGHVADLIGHIVDG
jgi:hypothetical protein